MPLGRISNQIKILMEYYEKISNRIDEINCLMGSAKGKRFLELQKEKEELLKAQDSYCGQIALDALSILRGRKIETFKEEYREEILEDIEEIRSIFNQSEIDLLQIESRLGPEYMFWRIQKKKIK